MTQEFQRDEFERIKRENMVCRNLMGAVTDVLQKDHLGLLTEIILKHLERCEEDWMGLKE